MGVTMMRFGGSGSMNVGRSRTKIWLALPVLALMLAAIAIERVAAWDSLRGRGICDWH